MKGKIIVLGIMLVVLTILSNLIADEIIKELKN